MKATPLPSFATLLALGVISLLPTAVSAQDMPPMPPGASAEDPVAETTPEAAAEEVIDGTPYEFGSRFSKLMARNPFDYEKPPLPEPEKIIPMADWLIAGISGTKDYTSVTIVNEKTSQRITLTKNADASQREREKKDAAGDVFKLIDLTFEPGKPLSRRSALAKIQRNGEPPGEVRWNSKADQLKPTGGGPNIQIPNYQAPAIKGMNPQMQQGGMAQQPGQPNPAQGVSNQAGAQTMQGVPLNNGGVQGQPSASAAATSAGQQQLLELLKQNKGGAAAANTTGGAAANSPLGRRRVVLPTATAPAPPN